jgi:hypothetical protein
VIYLGGLFFLALASALYVAAEIVGPLLFAFMLLEAMDCRIVGPAGKLETALQLAANENFDLAILDVTIRGGKVYPVAELLLS